MKTRKLISTLLSTGLLVLLATTVFASSSDSEEPKKDAGADQKKAAEKYNDGVAHMDKAREIAVVGDSAFAYNYRATSDAKARREYERAVKNFLSAVALNPKYKEAFNNMGFCYRKLGQLDESLAAYDKALKLDDKFERAREYRGETYLALGDLKKAQGEYEFLAKLESVYADTLAEAIKLYKLESFSKEMENSKWEKYLRHEASDRSIEIIETIAAPIERVWAAWTSTEEITAWLVKKANVELRIGGPFEPLFAVDAPEGSRGAEGCTILSYLPQRLLSFTWNAPPTIPELRKLGPCTWVVLEFEADGDSSTVVRFRQLGIKSGPEWDRYLDYFENAWPMVFKALKAHFQS